MKTFKSTVFTAFFLSGLPASVALLLHFSEIIQIEPEAFFSVSFLVGIVVFSYLSTMAYLIATTFLRTKTGKSEDITASIPTV
ncbi:MAG: hypothetical protein OTI34_13175 [Lewinella sp.]|nr:hypothetical protein [Lewinella sp.]